MISILGISGRLHTGKDTLGNVLVKQLGFKRIAFADGIREFLAKQFGWPLDFVHSEEFKTAKVLSNTVKWERQPDGGIYWKHEQEPVTGRDLLRSAGTEAAHSVIGPDVWVNVALAKATLAWDRGISMVFTDVRYPNELRRLQKAGARIIRLNRADRKDVHDFVGTGPICGAVLHSRTPGLMTTVECMLLPEAHPSHFNGHTHSSETALPDESNDWIKYDAVFTGSLEENTAAAMAWVKEGL